MWRTGDSQAGARLLTSSFQSKSRTSLILSPLPTLVARSASPLLMVALAGPLSCGCPCRFAGALVRDTVHQPPKRLHFFQTFPNVSEPRIFSKRMRCGGHRDTLVSVATSSRRFGSWSRKSSCPSPCSGCIVRRGRGRTGGPPSRRSWPARRSGYAFRRAWQTGGALPREVVAQNELLESDDGRRVA